MFRQSGLERIEINSLRYPKRFDYRNRSQVSEIIRECTEQKVSVVSMHGPDVLPYNSKDENVRKAAVKEAIEAARVAEEMGAGVMVCHFGTDDRSEKTVTEILVKLGNSSLKLADENGLDLREYIDFVDKVSSDRLGMVVDIGHTKDPEGINPFVMKERAYRTMAQCGSRLIHVHLHDFIETDHFAPIGGRIQWGEVFTAFRDIHYQGLFMFEAMYPLGKDYYAPRQVLRKIADFPKKFVESYGEA